MPLSGSDLGGVHSMMIRSSSALSIACLLFVGCAAPRAPDKSAPEALVAGADGEFSVPGFDKRAYSLRLPPGYDGATPIPVVLALHGGGGRKETARSVTCPGGKIDDEACITGVADRAGFAVVFPDGHPSAIENVRTWNAGGGRDGFQCVSGRACADGIDDVAFFDALHEELVRAFHVDLSRVYVTGLSNGAAMTHRLACERADRFAAIAPLGGGNQLAAVQGCEPSRPVAVLQLHGTADPCWTLEASSDACLQSDGLVKVGIRDSVHGWVERNGCSLEPAVEALDDLVDDGTTTVREIHGDCAGGADVVLLLSEGGGHTWPGGHQYFGASRIGPVVEDFSGSEEILRFFAAHPMPPR
jgi:polyhydroxybutyrate depolymerase